MYYLTHHPTHCVCVCAQLCRRVQCTPSAAQLSECGPQRPHHSGLSQSGDTSDSPQSLRFHLHHCPSARLRVSLRAEHSVYTLHYELIIDNQIKATVF